MKDTKKKFNHIALNIHHTNISYQNEIKEGEWKRKLNAFLLQVDHTKEWGKTNHMPEDIEPHINF